MTNYKKNTPFTAKLKNRTLLCGPGSSKKTYHLTLDLTGSDMTYEPGDAIAIIPENSRPLVDALLKALKKTGNEELVDPRSETSMSLKQFLLCKANLTRITPSLLKCFPDLQPLTTTEMKEKRKSFIEDNDVLSLFESYTCTAISPQELASHFAPLLPRFYSIASAQSQQQNSVDLLIVTFTYLQGGKIRSGIGSQFLCEYAKLNETPILTYHHPNALFKLPDDPSTPILMIGPGTGVAPYRAFLQKRMHQNATGKNWLFFGERNRATDFYYEDFFLELEKQDFLRLDLAFSRDQEQKIYVQDKIREHASEIWEWMSGNAVIYICGDARHMAKDVTATLHDIAEKEGALSETDAKQFIKELRKSKRLLIDAY